MDSGASHHITFDLQNLSINNNYGGNEDIIIGDGKRISITHTGSMKLNSHTTSFTSMMFCVHPTLKEILFLSLNATNKTILSLNSFLIIFLSRT
ncbi:hypothetical protein BHE74_00041014 [Ensete ventricosum]|nr:hypothetical protein BHE74_00041014 [Ensete ventricosum]